MNILEQCLDRFEKLKPVKYHFQISRKKVITNIIINFEESDFKHLIGLQYLKDISISRNSEKVYKGKLVPEWCPSEPTGL